LQYREITWRSKFWVQLQANEESEPKNSVLESRALIISSWQCNSCFMKVKYYVYYDLSSWFSLFIVLLGTFQKNALKSREANALLFCTWRTNRGP
jgi:hypothetical protein